MVNVSDLRSIRAQTPLMPCSVLEQDLFTPHSTGYYPGSSEWTVTTKQTNKQNKEILYTHTCNVFKILEPYRILNFYL